MKKTVITTIAGFQLFSLTAFAASVSLNDGWQFGPVATDVTGVVNLPHTWNEDAYLDKDYLRGKFIYRRALDLSPDGTNRRHYLRLEGASKSCRVLVNGHEAGSHRGGYTESVYSLSPYLKYDGSDILEIEVDNNRDDIPPISGDFTFFGGIYRDAWLEDYAPVHFSLNPFATRGISVSTSLEGAKGTIRAGLDLTNESSSPANVKAMVRVYAPDGRLVAESSKKVKIKADSRAEANFDFAPLDGVALWSPDSPSLYRVEAIVADSKGKELDRRSVSTGFRTFGFDADGRFILNGKPLKLRGVCRHQDMKPIGPALSDEMHRRDMQLAKDMGANFVRVSHYPQDPAILEACDRLGLIVWEEIPVIDFVPDDPAYADNAETALREMITQHRNHPSVMMWGYMNEILLRARNGKSDAEYAGVLDRTLALANRLNSVCKEMDPDRLTTMAYHGSMEYVKRGLSKVADVNGWNLYQGWYGGDLAGFERYLSDAWKAEPGKPIIVSEYGAGSDARLQSSAPVPFDFSIDYQQKYLEHYLPVIEDSAFVAGSSHWNLIDFGSAKREESMPRINNKGILYADRTPKDVYYLFQAHWKEDGDMVRIASRDKAVRTVVSDSETVMIPVKVYSNAPEVTLRVDGGEPMKAAVSNRVAEFSVPMRGGLNTLEARGGDARDVFAVEVRTLPEHFTAANADGVELAVNVGGNCDYTSPLSGLTWVADREYTPGSWGRVGGAGKTVTAEMAGTADLPLFQSMAEGLEAYRFDVPDGTYEVELGFADPSGKSAGLAYMLGRDKSTEQSDNVFGIIMEGVEVDGAYSPSAAAGSRFASRIKRTVDVTDGNLEISFVPVKGHAVLNSIKLRRL